LIITIALFAVKLAPDERDIKLPVLQRGCRLSRPQHTISSWVEKGIVQAQSVARIALTSSLA